MSGLNGVHNKRVPLYIRNRLWTFHAMQKNELWNVNWVFVAGKCLIDFLKPPEEMQWISDVSTTAKNFLKKLTVKNEADKNRCRKEIFFVNASLSGKNAFFQRRSYDLFFHFIFCVCWKIKTFFTGIFFQSNLASSMTLTAKKVSGNKELVPLYSAVDDNFHELFVAVLVKKDSCQKVRSAWRSSKPTDWRINNR